MSLRIMPSRFYYEVIEMILVRSTTASKAITRYHSLTELLAVLMMHIGANYLGSILKKLSDSKRKAAMSQMHRMAALNFFMLIASKVLYEIS
ncbi:hypothetical protein BRADI_4g03266v3 [Brachypodium distachyon]|uniref:Uncharacterized protein n=1 Tax=Brachypodium distachyon TaxID=15368 RepID=A0A2K2CK73_BRADI|nr:hypothetical protein BRADI_4g03266v3 [Brachypodium distachyon]